MAEQLDSLLKKIHDEAVAKADAAARERSTAAEKQAAQCVAEAERRAADIIAAAEKNAAQLIENSKQTLEQAGRDLLIYLRQAIEAQFAALIKDAVPELVPVTVVQDILVRLASDADREKHTAEGVCVYVSEKDFTPLAEFLLQRFRERMQHGVELHPLPGIKAGLRIAIANKNVVYDFSDDVIVRMLSELVGPMLKDVLGKAGALKQQ
jgi:V/A-type H+-transporting ATPase subunit E